MREGFRLDDDRSDAVRERDDAGSSGGVVGQRGQASSSGAVVQAGRDAVVTVEQHVHHWWPDGRSARIGAAALGGAAVLGGVGVVVRSGVLVQGVPAWTVPVAAVLVAVPLLVRRARRRTGTRHAFVVTSAFNQKYWIADLVQRLHRALDRKGMDLVLKLPDRDYDAAAQAHDLRRILTTRDGYLGGFVVPTELARVRPHLAEFCTELALPVVFTDLDPFDDESEYPDNAAFVGYVDPDLGTEAGRWLVADLRRRGVRRPHVLIVASSEHPDRQRYCADLLRTALGDVSITVDDTCAFNRSRAYDAVLAHIRSRDARQVRLDAVFCTNDEMALGTVDALRVSQTTKDTVVIGIDGIQEVRDLIATAASPLRATVVQDSHRLAESAVEVLQRMLDGRKTLKRTILKPEVYQTPWTPPPPPS